MLVLSRALRRLIRGGAVVGALALLMGGCASRPAASNGSASQQKSAAAIKRILQDQVLAWNSGDLAGFMDAYARGEDTRFVSGGTVTQGWQTVFDRYRSRYPNAERMGRVTFSEIQVEMISSEFAFGTGAWQLDRVDSSASGRFTLLFRRLPEGWRIVYDHTSAADP